MLTSVVPQSLSRLVVSLAKSTVLDSPDRAMSSDTCRVVLELWKRKTSKKLPNIIVFLTGERNTAKLISRAKRH